MKVKNLIGINPEAEIKVVFVDGKEYEGKLTYGWSNEGAEIPEGVDSKSVATELCIFLGDIQENSGKA